MESLRFEKLTILSMVLFEFLIMIMTITPYGKIGNSNHFADKGMLYSMVLIVLMYSIPLMFYKLNISGMKYILAAVIGICTIGTGFIFILVCLPAIIPVGVLVTFFKQFSVKDYFICVIAGVICIGVITINVMWYAKIFSKQK